MNAVEAEARCRAIVAALWPEHEFHVDPLATCPFVRVKAAMPFSDGLIFVASTASTSVGGAWLALLPIIERRAQSAAEQMVRDAANLEASAAALRTKAERVRAVIAENAPTEAP